VAECGVASGSHITHATLCPAFTRTLGGTKANLLMNTIVAPAVFPGVVQLAVSIVVAAVERSEKQATAPRVARASSSAASAPAFDGERTRWLI
jgi:hypothetical protein